MNAISMEQHLMSRFSLPCRFILPVLLLGAVLISCPEVLASGFMVREHSTAGLGTAFSGLHSGAHDLADVFFNPAALGQSNGTQVSLSMQSLSINSTFKLNSATNVLGMPIPGNPGGADVAPQATIPAFYLAMDAGRDTRFGVAVNAPWGLRTVQPAGWVGRYHALESDLKSLNTTPMLSRKVSTTTTLALGVQLQKVEASLSNAIDFGLIGAGAKLPGAVPGTQDGLVQIEGDDWGAGFVLGMLYEPSAMTRWGLSYRSQVRHTLSGRSRFALDPVGIGAALSGATGAFKDTGVNADLNTPGVLGLGVSHSFNDRWLGMLDLTRTFWGEFDELRIRFDNPAQADAVTSEEWDDTWFLSLGAAYKASDRWTCRFGVAMDQGPADDAHRIPRVPTSSNRMLGVGATYRMSGDTSIDLGVLQAWYDRGEIRLVATDPGNRTAGNLSGAYTTDVTILGLTFQSRF